jgi:hypothetical protein
MEINKIGLKQEMSVAVCLDLFSSFYKEIYCEI